MSCFKGSAVLKIFFANDLRLAFKTKIRNPSLTSFLKLCHLKNTNLNLSFYSNQVASEEHLNTSSPT